MVDLERKLTAILAADVVSFSKYMSQDEEGTLGLVKRLETEILTPIVEEHSGKIFKKMGDGYLADFPSVVGAIKAAIDIQNSLTYAPFSYPDNVTLGLRIGVNSGDVIIDDGDIYGDGVNLAVRVQSICNPSAIAISAKVHQEIQGKLAEEFVSTGFHQLKNIENAIEIFMWPPDIEQVNETQQIKKQKLNPTLTKPSIAVLPFVNMSNDPEQEYFCDGITEDVITELSRFDSVFVISRNSAFTFKNVAVDTKTAAKELQVQYVLEGSVRKAGQKVRISAQLIDGNDDSHLWAERYDGLLEDVFDLQEQVTRQVVMSLVPEIISKQSAIGTNTQRIFDESYDKAWRASALVSEATQTNKPEQVDLALNLCLTAININPRCEAAYNNAGVCLFVKSLFGWGEAPERASQKALELATQLLGNIQNSVTGYRVRGLARTRQGDFRAALSDLEKARELNPNDSETAFGLSYALASLARSEDAKECAMSAYKLSPKDPYLGRFFYLTMAMCTFVDRDNDKFLDWAEKAIQAAPNAPIRRALMIAYASEINNYELAEQHFHHLRTTSPTFIESVIDGRNTVFSEQQSNERLVNGLKVFLNTLSSK